MDDNKTRICPICELNYLKSDEEICFTCAKTRIINKHKTEEYLQTIVESSEILNRVSASAIFQAVRYLTNDYGEYSIYEKEHKWNYRSLLNHLRENHKYAIAKYPSKAGFSYIFDRDDIWENFFLKDSHLLDILNYRRITAIDELLYHSNQWHNSR